MDQHVVVGGGAHREVVRDLVVAELRSRGRDPRAVLVGADDAGSGRHERELDALRRAAADLLDGLGVAPPVVAGLVERVVPSRLGELLRLADVLGPQDEGGTPDPVVVEVAGLSAPDLLEQPARYARTAQSLVPVVARWGILLCPPGITGAAHLPAPGTAVLAALRQIADRLASLDRVLADPATGIHLAPAAGPAGTAEHGEALVALALMGRRATSLHDGATGAPLRLVGEEVIPEPALRGSTAPRLRAEQVRELDPVPPRWRCEIDVPGLRAGDLDLVRHDDDLVLACGGRRRTLTLPSVLRRCVVDRAGVRDGVLTLTMSADPGEWPRAG